MSDKAADRIVSLLVSVYPSSMTSPEIARHLNLPGASVRRVRRGLESAGLIVRADTRAEAATFTVPQTIHAGV